MKTIKILVCYHKKFPLLEDEILTPIHLGRARANKDSDDVKWLMEHMIGDDTGENISDKNAYYNEMTALYWAWKNYDKLGNPDYIGLAHYRRHFVMEENVAKTYSVRYYDEDKILDVLDYTPEKLHKIVDGCDFVTHIGRVYNLYQHYVDNQRQDDIDVAMEILKEMFPEYADTADAYMAGKISNFYNMNIFSRELFFQYCEFVFPIMEKFEERMPSVKNRRMFISERLTAIFVKKLMDDEEYKYKYLPVAFIEEPLDINIAAYVTDANVRSVAVSMQSILRYTNAYNHYVFYLFHNPSLEKEMTFLLEDMVKGHKHCELVFIEYAEGEEQLPMRLPFLLPKLNKCLLITEAAVATIDIAEFYRLIVVDDFFVSGVPEVKYDQSDEDKRIVFDMMMLNCKRIRTNTKLEDYVVAFEEGESGMTVLHKAWKDEIKYIAYYWYVSERLFLTDAHVYLKNKSRQQLQIEATWCPMILFDSIDPFINIQGIYAKFWWIAYQELPDELKKIPYDEKLMAKIWKNQLDEIWLKENYGIINYDPSSMQKEQELFSKEETVLQQVEVPAQEDWRSYGLWGKLKFYYKHNGMKNTVKYAGKKLFGRKGQQ